MNRLGTFLKRTRKGLAILGVFTLAIALIAVHVAAVKFFADSRLGTARHRGVPREVAVKPPPPPTFPASDYLQTTFPRPTGQPFIGVNYTHHGFRRCSYNGTAILRSYHKPEIAAKVHSQLSQMRKAGVATIRTVIWHMTDPANQYWGPIPSAAGRVHEPYRTNLIDYLTEIRRFGFFRFTVVFSPQQENNPLLPKYDSAKFIENWRFIKNVRSLVKRYGPRRTRFDLVSEGGPSLVPSQWSPVPRQTGRYLRDIYTRYVKRFGNRDVTVSAIASERRNVAKRLLALVRIFRSARVPPPRWYDVHIPYDSAGAAHALGQIDRTLTRAQQDQPLVIGETAYDNPGVARAIRHFLQRSARPIQEISPWYQWIMRGCQVSPPYVPGAYSKLPLARRGTR